MNYAPWTDEEDALLRGLISKHGKKWTAVALALGNGRTAKQVHSRWNNVSCPDIKRGTWTKDEDNQLRDAVIKYGKRWTLIMRKLDTKRSSMQLRSRWTNVLDPSILHGPWTAEEDAILRAAVQKLGPTKWSVIARTSGLCRSPIQVFRRWTEALDANINRSPWTTSEDERLVYLVQEHGRKWAKIRDLTASGRTGTQLLHRWKLLQNHITGRAAP
jgi:myb proto-oncogene protein